MKRIITKTDFAELLGISRQALYKAIKAERITPLETGKIDVVKACYEWEKHWVDKERKREGFW